MIMCCGSASARITRNPIVSQLAGRVTDATAAAIVDGSPVTAGLGLS